jgi:hypothetical protein
MASHHPDRHCNRPMRTLIYKRTHSGDPDPKTGVFGCNNCMRTVRGWGFNAVIGIGGRGREPEREGIACKLTWIGIGKHETISDRSRPFVTPSCPLVTFDHFLYYGEQGPLLKNIAPVLARRMLYDQNVRKLMDSLSSKEQREVEKILDLAMDAPPSRQLTERDFRDTNGKCRPKSRGVRTTDDCRPLKRRNIKVRCES